MAINAILLCLILFSIASGVASISYKDVTGKTIPKETRGQMLSYRATFGGLLSLIAGILLVFVFKSIADNVLFAALFAIASLLWLIAALLFYNINEAKGATEGGRTPVKELKNGIELIKKDQGFSRFLITRSLLMAIPLLEPFYVVIAKEVNETSWSLLGYLIIVNGLAQVISSPFWGKLADRSAVSLMRISSLMAIAALVYCLCFLVLDWDGFGFYIFLPVIFINGIAYSGARLSRKTYLVNYAPAKERPTYIAIANTAIGLFTIVAAGFGIIAQFYGLKAQLLFFMTMLISVVILTFFLKDSFNSDKSTI